jgi:serine protease AprX
MHRAMERRQIEELFYGQSDQQHRFTQDFPVLPDVWMEFAQNPNERMELLLTPHYRTDAASLAQALRVRVQEEGPEPPPAGPGKRAAKPNSKPPRILFNEAVVLAHFTFWELLRVALPLTDWWKRVLAPIEKGEWNRENLIARAKEADGYRIGTVVPKGDPKLLKKLIAVVGAIGCDRQGRPLGPKALAENALSPRQVEAFATLFAGLSHPDEARGLLWSVSRNRPAQTSVWRSRMSTKADAAARLFAINASGIRWAVLDTGVDATHPAFARRNGRDAIKGPGEDENGKPETFQSRVVRTYDFMRVKDLLDPETPVPAANSAAAKLPKDQLKQLAADLALHLKRGRSVDWDLLEPFLRVPHDENYIKPVAPHGTHVAGIIAADWPESVTDTALDQAITGMCPDLELFDLRVLGPGADEFTIIAALQFVRHFNAHKDNMTIHGVNLSMSVQHDVANYACGRTPVCEECERVVNAGVVVVSAAGNRGFNKFASPEGGASGDYRYISITDPGNADSVITVGSTHRFMPHNYGVSYFSSRGPTGDGRTKPDLVAPGERIDSCSLEGDYETMDGTSMAAPHVSGAAALLMARHRELAGQPRRIKEIICKSATDLGREPRFQGAGMLDVLRALQSV